MIISILRFLVADNPYDWPSSLSTATFALNSAYNRAIGDTPYFLMFAQDPRMLFDTFFDPKPDLCYNVDSYKTCL